MSCYNFKLSIITRLDFTESYTITSVNGTATSITVPTPHGDFWPVFDELDIAYNDLIEAALVAAGYSGQYPFVIADGVMTLVTQGSDTLTLDFTTAPKTLDTLRMDALVYSVTSTPIVAPHPIKGVVWGSQPLLEYTVDERRRREVFYTDSGNISTLSRIKSQKLSFAIQVKGQPQSAQNKWSEYHDLVTWYKGAARGIPSRVYPIQTGEISFYPGARSNQLGYREFQMINNELSPSPLNQSRGYHSLSIEGKII